MKRYPQEIKESAKRLYVRGYTVSEISREMGMPVKTVSNWRDRADWDSYCPPDTVEIALARRINILAEKDHKTEHEQAELSALVRDFGNLKLQLSQARLTEAQADALANGRAWRVGVPGEADFSDEPEKIAKSDKKPGKRSKKVKNDVSGITPEMWDDFFENKMFFVEDEYSDEPGAGKWYGAFKYQKLWRKKRYDPETKRNRQILKSRQIGATAYFAAEAFECAARYKRNQIFLSASRDQAMIFKAYIIAYAKNAFDVEIKGAGSEIVLSNGAILRFLSTNSDTGQGYNGDLYIDEIFWIRNYKRLKKLASGMASQKRWCRTYFSTPSAMSHEAYGSWIGSDYCKKHESEQSEFDVSHAALKDGWLGPDRVWRHIVTIEDAEAQGCDLFDIAELRDEYSTDDFNNLFMCKFIDDSQSVFKLSKLLDCTVEVDEWPDYKPDNARPFANKPVSLGYDPSRVRDNASLGNLAIPLMPGEAWRVLRTDSYHGQNFQYQSNRIKDVKDTHNVQFIGIDTTGIGHGVFELVQSWYPQVTPIHYSMEMKTKLVVKALDVIENGRLKYKAGDHEITRAFLMISKTTTGSGQITYASNRSTEAGHADVAWSIMHALQYEPIDNNARKTTATFSD